MTEGSKKTILPGLAFAIIATLVFGILNSIGVIASTLYLLITSWKSANIKIGTLYYRMALADDQMSNVILGPLLNKAFVKPEFPSSINGVRTSYGNQDDTISDITGRLEITGGLNKSGKRLRDALDAVLGEKHCSSSVSLKDAEMLR